MEWGRIRCHLRKEAGFECEGVIGQPSPHNVFSGELDFANHKNYTVFQDDLHKYHYLQVYILYLSIRDLLLFHVLLGLELLSGPTMIKYVHSVVLLRLYN